MMVLFVALFAGAMLVLLVAEVLSGERETYNDPWK